LFTSPGALTQRRREPYFRGANRKGNALMSLEFSADAQRKINALCERYPSKQPVVMAALHLAQKEHGHLSDDALKLVARTLDLPYAHVYGVATFYTMYRREPAGKTTIRMCTNISCMLRGGYEVLAAFEQKLGIKKGGSTTDGRFHLVEEECIAACANAPCAVVGKKYFLDIKTDQVGKIIDELKNAPSPESEVV
jgi:NADH-quinone oxidoreductase E subunit